MGRWSARAVVVAACLAVAPTLARALVVELDDVAADRVERQRAFQRGSLPLPDTPDTRRLAERLAAKGLKLGDPLFLRLFKDTSRIEAWMRKGEQFVLLDSYPICNWTGTLGPKLREGDKQSPEGFYSIARPQLRHLGRWRRALNIGFPNAYDRREGRTGSYILIHGGCSSTGCFALTNPVQDEIYALAEAALKAGQKRVHIHIYPFRMTDTAMAAHPSPLWGPFWRDLKRGYDAFERTRVPPHIAICGHRYAVADGAPGETGDEQPLAPARQRRIASTDATPPADICATLPQEPDTTEALAVLHGPPPMPDRAPRAPDAAAPADAATPPAAVTPANATREPGARRHARTRVRAARVRKHRTRRHVVRRHRARSAAHASRGSASGS